MSAPSPTNVDNWDDHWDQYASTASENPAQRYRREQVFASLGEPRRLLDVGSGQGDLLLEVNKRWVDADLLGIELSASGIDVARRKVPVATFVQRNLLEAAPASDEHAGWATHAVCSEVLEHVDDPVLLLQQARRYMAPGCVLVVTVPGGPRSTFDRHIGHRRHFTTSALRDVLSDAGFDVIDIRGAGFPVFNIYKLLVIARGRKLVDDVSSSSASPSSGLAGAVMKAFVPLFWLARPRSRWGWQMIAVARVPD
jgi:trans-aconitate methyltransferase